MKQFAEPSQAKHDTKSEQDKSIVDYMSQQESYSVRDFHEALDVYSRLPRDHEFSKYKETVTKIVGLAMVDVCQQSSLESVFDLYAGLPKELLHEEYLLNGLVALIDDAQPKVRSREERTEKFKTVLHRRQELLALIVNYPNSEFNNFYPRFSFDDRVVIFKSLERSGVDDRALAEFTFKDMDKLQADYPEVADRLFDLYRSYNSPALFDCFAFFKPKFEALPVRVKVEIFLASFRQVQYFPIFNEVFQTINLDSQDDFESFCSGVLAIDNRSGSNYLVALMADDRYCEPKVQQKLLPYIQRGLLAGDAHVVTNYLQTIDKNRFFKQEDRQAMGKLHEQIWEPVCERVLEQLTPEDKFHIYLRLARISDQDGTKEGLGEIPKILSASKLHSYVQTIVDDANRNTFGSNYKSIRFELKPERNDQSRCTRELFEESPAHVLTKNQPQPPEIMYELLKNIIKRGDAQAMVADFELHQLPEDKWPEVKPILFDAYLKHNPAKLLNQYKEFKAEFFALDSGDQRRLLAFGLDQLISPIIEILRDLGSAKPDFVTGFYQWQHDTYSRSSAVFAAAIAVGEPLVGVFITDQFARNRFGLLIDLLENNSKLNLRPYFPPVWFEKLSLLLAKYHDAFTGAQSDKVSEYIRNVVRNNCALLTDIDSLAILADFIVEFGLVKTPILMEYYFNIKNVDRGELSQLPVEQFNEDLTDIQHLQRRFREIRAKVISGDIPSPDQMTKFDYDILAVETKFYTSRWKRDYKKIDQMHREFAADQQAGRLLSLPQGYDAETIAVDQIEKTEVDVSLCAGEYLLLRRDLLRAEQLNENLDVDRFKTEVASAIDEEVDNLRSQSVPVGARQIHDKKIDALISCRQKILAGDNLDSILKTLIALESKMNVKGEFPPTSPFIRAIIFSKTLVHHSGFARIPDEIVNNDTPNSLGLKYFKDLIHNLVKEHIVLPAETWENVDQSKKIKAVLRQMAEYPDGEINEKLFSELKVLEAKQARYEEKQKKLAAAEAYFDSGLAPTRAEAGRLAKILAIPAISEVLRRQGERLLLEKAQVGIIPDRGFAGELSGYYGEACYTGIDNMLRIWPNVIPAKMVIDNKETDVREIIGSVLFIETIAVNGVKVLVVRAVNPRDEYLNRLKASSVCEKIFNLAAEYGRNRGCGLVLVSTADGTISNRTDIIKYVQAQYPATEQTIVPLQSPLDFNSYQIQNACVAVRTIK
ncbi:TPA: hypothetical protein DF272_02345 [Candidatus Falkowbacteria bacterium]|nr:hypothetical protein [Candidatus Falkowbacteria bacterium]